MRTVGLVLFMILLAAPFGCGNKSSEGINRDKDKPRPEEPKAGMPRHKGALLEDTSQETHPLAWVGCLRALCRS